VRPFAPLQLPAGFIPPTPIPSAPTSTPTCLLFRNPLPHSAASFRTLDICIPRTSQAPFTRSSIFRNAAS